MSTRKPEVEEWEDRSGEWAAGRPENAFGFVYFTDGSRVGYSPDRKLGVTTVWQPNTNGGGEYKKVTRRHLTLAHDLLHKNGIIK